MTTVREPRKLPLILSPREVKRLLDAAPGLKYKAALSVAYGAGLRAAEVARLNRMIDAGMIGVDAPYLGAWAELPEMHQAMWENRLPEHAGGAAKAVVNHALPQPGLKHRNDLFAAWAEAGAVTPAPGRGPA